MAFHSLSAIGELASAQTMIQRARTLFPVNSRLISRSVVLAVTQRQPVNGRRLSLLERLFDLENTFHRRRGGEVIKILLMPMKMEDVPICFLGFIRRFVRIAVRGKF